MRILFSLVSFFALLLFIEATKCYEGSEDPPKKTVDCNEEGSTKCGKLITRDGKIGRYCAFNNEPDGCRAEPANEEIPAPYTTCFCSEDKCNDYPEKNQEATKCYIDSEDPPKETWDCFKPISKCGKAIYKGGKAMRDCALSSLSDGCKKVPAQKEVAPEHTECVCSKDKCNDYPEKKSQEKKSQEKKSQKENVASCILPSYMLWISSFVATTWCKYASESL